MVMFYSYQRVKVKNMYLACQTMAKRHKARKYAGLRIKTPSLICGNRKSWDDLLLLMINTYMIFGR